MMWLKRLKTLTNRGDTIVEVLIVTAVLGLIIGSSYAIASRSLKGVRQAQERGEALKLAEGQIEALKVMNAKNDADTDQIYQTNTIFCVDLASQSTPYNLSSYPTTVITPATSDNFDAYPAQCVHGFYHIAVQVDPVPSDSNRFNFTVFVRWDSLGNSGRDEVTMRYRMLKG
jgi:type II secretory pathway pseudopilin PulG